MGPLGHAHHFGWGCGSSAGLRRGAHVLEEAIDVAASAGPWNTVQWAHADLAVAKVHVGDLATARDLFDRAAQASREVGDGAGEALATYGCGLLAEVEGDWSAAGPRYAEAVAGFERLGTPVWVGIARAGLGRCAEALADPGAGDHFAAALTVGRELGEPSVTAAALEGLGRLARAQGRPEEGDRLAGEAAEVRERFVRPMPPHERRAAGAASTADGTPTPH